MYCCNQLARGRCRLMDPASTNSPLNCPTSLFLFFVFKLRLCQPKYFYWIELPKFEIFIDIYLTIRMVNRANKFENCAIVNCSSIVASQQNRERGTLLMKSNRSHEMESSATQTLDEASSNPRQSNDHGIANKVSLWVVSISSYLVQNMHGNWRLQRISSSALYSLTTSCTGFTLY